MGYLTTVTLHNDRMHEFRAKAITFHEELFAAIDEANATTQKASVMGGHITAHPSRHADDETIYIHHGNTTVDLNSLDFLKLIEECPEIAADYIQVAERIVNNAKRRMLRKPKATK